MYAIFPLLLHIPPHLNNLNDVAVLYCITFSSIVSFKLQPIYLNAHISLSCMTVSNLLLYIAFHLLQHITHTIDEISKLKEILTKCPSFQYLLLSILRNALGTFNLYCVYWITYLLCSWVVGTRLIFLISCPSNQKQKVHPYYYQIVSGAL